MVPKNRKEIVQLPFFLFFLLKKAFNFLKTFVIFFLIVLRSPNNKKLINSKIKICPKLTLIYFKNVFNFLVISIVIIGPNCSKNEF